MGAYHQMGHDSWNLLGEVGLEQFAGAIISPVNCNPADCQAKIESLDNAESLEFVFDPQLYVPRSSRGDLARWAYFDAGCDTVDLSNSDWWMARCQSLSNVAQVVGLDAVCSPTVLPRVYDDGYYASVLSAAEQLALCLHKTNIDVLLTAVVPVNGLGVQGTSDRIASLLTRGNFDRIYLIFHDDLTARQQWTDVDAIAGALSLIRSLSGAGCNVLVGYSGLDMLLWKYAGAASVATGKYFNLRRFGKERWETAETEGRVVEYWTEPNLLTWLREGDVTLLQRRLPQLLAQDGNPFTPQILSALAAVPRQAWRALSWRQYLWWFAQTEQALAQDAEAAIQMMRTADANWAALEASRVLLFDRTNDGSWIRPWLNATLLG